MCRFLMFKSREPVPAGSLLDMFASMAERSRAPDGDRQADGWGVSWLDRELRWKARKSINPIWTETALFEEIPPGRLFLAHARSASFPSHKNILAFNQPFVDGRYAFVFNGLLKGVTLPRLAGIIGAQKIWSLLRALLEEYEPVAAIRMLVSVLERHAREIPALNIGVSDGEKLYVYCRDSHCPGYYHLRVRESPGMTLVCSESLECPGFRPVQTDEVLAF